MKLQTSAVKIGCLKRSIGRNWWHKKSKFVADWCADGVISLIDKERKKMKRKHLDGFFCVTFIRAVWLEQSTFAEMKLRCKKILLSNFTSVVLAKASMSVEAALFRSRNSNWMEIFFYLSCAKFCYSLAWVKKRKTEKKKEKVSCQVKL